MTKHQKSRQILSLPVRTLVMEIIQWQRAWVKVPFLKGRVSSLARLGRRCRPECVRNWRGRNPTRGGALRSYCQKGPTHRLPDLKTEESHTARVLWPGPSPRPRGAGATHRPGAKAPGQRPSRPKAGASHPPGRALAFVALGGTVLWGCGPLPGGETRCVSLSARNNYPVLPVQMILLFLRAVPMPAEQSARTPIRPYTPARVSRISRRISLAASGILVPGPKMALTPWSYKNW